jgi:hypothetical protein
MTLEIANAGFSTLAWAIPLSLLAYGCRWVRFRTGLGVVLIGICLGTISLGMLTKLAMDRALIPEAERIEIKQFLHDECRPGCRVVLNRGNASSSDSRR